MTEKAVIYLRVSTDEQTEESQLEPCKNYCKEKGWEVIKIYRDHGKSAYKEDKYRPEFMKMLEDAKKREFQHIVVFAMDRFSRQPPVRVLEMVRELSVLYGVQVNAVTGGEWRNAIEAINQLARAGTGGYMSEVLRQLASMLETIMIGALAEQARYESRKIGERVRASVKFQKAKKENRIGRQPKISEKELKWLQQLKEKYPAMGWRTLAKKLNEERSDPSSELYFKKQHPDAKKIDVVSYVTVKRAMEGEK